MREQMQTEAELRRMSAQKTLGENIVSSVTSSLAIVGGAMALLLLL
jgi:hypothetical protein